MAVSRQALAAPSDRVGTGCQWASTSKRAGGEHLGSAMLLPPFGRRGVATLLAPASPPDVRPSAPTPTASPPDGPDLSAGHAKTPGHTVRTRPDELRQRVERDQHDPLVDSHSRHRQRGIPKPNHLYAVCGWTPCDRAHSVRFTRAIVLPVRPYALYRSQLRQQVPTRTGQGVPGSGATFAVSARPDGVSRPDPLPGPNAKLALMAL